MTGNVELSENEINNIIYLGLRYVCGQRDLPNEDIEVIMLLLGDDRSIDNIIEQTIQFARRQTGTINIDFRTSSRKRHMFEFVERFLRLNVEVRSDLGSDTAFFNSPVLH